MIKLNLGLNRLPVKSVLLGATVLTGLAAVIGVPALATPSSGFARTGLSEGLLNAFDAKADKSGKWDLTLKTKDTSTVGIDQLTVSPGGYSGWHTHTGITMVTVAAGQVEWTDGETCAVRTLHVGETIVEPANHVHNVRNPFGNTATLVAVQMRPEATPGRVDVPVAPNCPT